MLVLYLLLCISKVLQISYDHFNVDRFSVSSVYTERFEVIFGDIFKTFLMCTYEDVLKKFQVSSREKSIDEHFCCGNKLPLLIKLEKSELVFEVL